MLFWRQNQNFAITGKLAAMNRREFLKLVGIGGLASYLPVVIAACSPQSEISELPTTQTHPDGFEAVGTVMELNQKGQLLIKQGAGKVLVVRNPSDPKTVTAVNPACTHKGCTVEWKADKQAFICPCHGASFALDGKAIKGPAQKPLTTYTSKIEANSVLVKIK